MSRIYNIVLHLNHAYAFDRRAFNGMTMLANGTPNVRLLRRMNGMSYRDALARRQADGIIASRIDESEEIKDLAASGKPYIVLADHQVVLADNEYVVALDEDAIGRLAAKHFLSGGYTHFAVICRPSIREFFARRIGSFCEAVAEVGYSCVVGPPSTHGEPTNDATTDEWETIDNLTWDTGMEAYLRSLPKPLAVFAPYDYYGQVAVNAARAGGMAVPEEVAVVGVDDDDVYCMTTTPQLCSIKTPAQLIGQQAMAQMLDLLNGKPNVPRRTLIQPGEIMLRGSSCDTAVQDADVIAALQYIQNNVAKGVTVGQVADHVLLSRRTLERRFMETLSRTVQAEIRRTKIRLAQRLLVDTTLSYEEVARRSGLVTRSQLNRTIKTEIGLTPMQYRQNNTGQKTV